MKGRADTEGSKSNVDMCACRPQARYPCGNFSDTSNLMNREVKGSIGHAFAVRTRTGSRNRASFYPSVRHEISVLDELALGHLRYPFTDVPPQPNSPPDSLLNLSPADRGLVPFDDSDGRPPPSSNPRSGRVLPLPLDEGELTTTTVPTGGLADGPPDVCIAVETLET